MGGTARRCQPPPDDSRRFGRVPCDVVAGAVNHRDRREIVVDNLLHGDGQQIGVQVRRGLHLGREMPDRLLDRDQQVDPPVHMNLAVGGIELQLCR